MKLCSCIQVPRIQYWTSIYKLYTVETYVTHCSTQTNFEPAQKKSTCSSFPDHPAMTEIIKDGYLSVKEDGLRAWIWSKRFCVLRDQALTFHRNEVRDSFTCTPRGRYT